MEFANLDHNITQEDNLDRDEDYRLEGFAPKSNIEKHTKSKNSDLVNATYSAKYESNREGVTPVPLNVSESE